LSIYKPCDIRGSAAEQLTPDLYRSWGRALGLRVLPMAKFVVGGDVRGSTPQFLAALVEGLCSAGVDVVELGLLPTPMIYYARRRLAAAGCAIVTASHNPAAVNGLKWAIDGKPPTPQEVAQLRRAVESPVSEATGRKATTPRPLDVTFDYIAWQQLTWVEAISARLHIVLDPMHGCWAGRARRYLQAIFPQCLFSTIHDSPDAAFAGRAPDCSRQNNLAELAEIVYRQRAHLGLAFDGDGDRVAFVDEEGMALSAEEAAFVLLHSFNSKLLGKQFVYDLKFSDCISQTAEQLGAKPVAERSGHAFIRARMQQTGALFGAEISGHYFFGELDGSDDGLFAACRMIAYVAGSRTTLAHLRRECPPVFMTPDLRISLEPAAQKKLIGQVRTAWSDFRQTTIDGVRIETPAGWALVRSSVTEPALTFRFESVDWSGLEYLVRRFCDTLPEVGEQLWTRYQAAVGVPG